MFDLFVGAKCVANIKFPRKKTQKMKKQVSSDEIKQLLDQAEKVQGTEIKVIAGKSSYEGAATAGMITREDNYVAHIFDGDKLVSMASENVDIDLRKIAVDIGKILGGGGGGKPRMTQCGGPNKNRADEALEKAKQQTISKLKKK